MKSTQISFECQDHKEICVAINLDPQFDSFRHYCVQCLKDPYKLKNSNSYKEANDLLASKKKQFKFRKEIQNSENLQTLESLTQNLSYLKLDYICLIDDLIHNIQCQATQIANSQQELDSQLENIDIETYLSQGHQFSENQSNFKVFQEQIQKQLTDLIDDKRINFCLQKLLMMNDEFIILSPDHQFEQQSIINTSSKLPKLSFQCELHNQKMRYYYQNDQIPRENRIICDECSTNIQGTFIPLYQIYKSWQKLKEGKMQKLDTSQTETKAKIDTLQKEINMLREEFYLIIMSIENDLQEFQKQIQQDLENQRLIIQKEWEKLSKDEIVTIADQIQEQSIAQHSMDSSFQQYNTIVNQKIQKSIINLQESYHLFAKRIIQTIDNEKQTKIRIQTIPKQTDQRQTTIQKQTQKLDRSLTFQSAVVKFELKQQKPISYKLIPDLSVMQNDHCYAIAFSQDQKFMIAACGNNIKCYEFQKGKLTEKMLLEGHKSNVLALYFIKQSASYSFISGGMDSQIFVWKLQDDSYSQQILRRGHSRFVNCIIMNKCEDLMVTCGDDNSIKFWNLNQEQWSCSKTLKTPNHSSSIQSISFNESENKLVSCGSDKVIIISEKINMEWQIVQSIQVQLSGHRIHFIRDNTIIFQPLNSEVIEIFKQNIDNQQFEKFTQVQVQKFSRCSIQFPMQYNLKLNLLLSKNGSRVNIFRITQDSDLILEQSIEFQKHIVYGALTGDGQYLVTWSDEINKSFQIRVLQ